MIAKRKRSDRGHFETTQQIPLVTDAKAETGRHAEVARVATRKPRVKVGGQREAEVAQIGGVGPGQVSPGAARSVALARREITESVDGFARRTISGFVLFEKHIDRIAIAEHPFHHFFSGKGHRITNDPVLHSR